MKAKASGYILCCSAMTHTGACAYHGQQTLQTLRHVGERIISDNETPKAELTSRLAVNAAAYRMSEAIHLLTQSGVRGDWVSVNAALASIKVGVRMIEDEYDSLTCAHCGKLAVHHQFEVHTFLKKDA